MIRGMHHAALSVSDIERSISFYSELLGLSLLRLIESSIDMDLGSVNGMPGSTARIAHLGSDSMMLELFQYISPQARLAEPDRNQADIGYIHVGFTSTDVKADYRVLKAKGVSFLGEPVEFRPGVWIVYFKGPDGEVCELRESAT